MMNKLYLIRKPVRLICTWVPTGSPQMPLACVWTELKAAQATPIASFTEEAGPEAGRMHLCA
jgi:hypothetical protein